MNRRRLGIEGRAAIQGTHPNGLLPGRYHARAAGHGAPADPSPAPYGPGAAAATPDETKRPPRILLAERSRLVRDALRAVLEGPGLGADIIEAKTLADALSLASDGAELDIMAVGQTLPGMNSVDGVAAIKRALPDLPVAVLSGTCRRQAGRRAPAARPTPGTTGDHRPTRRAISTQPHERR